MGRSILFALLLLLASCASNDIGHSRDVNQDQINQGFTVNYDEAKDKTELIVFFRFAGPTGTTLLLDSPSTILLDGEEMQKIEAIDRGCYYTKVFNGKMPDKKYVFEFTDCNGKKISNTLSWRNMDLDSLPAQIKTGDDLTINFTDDPEGRREEVRVEISDTAHTITQTYAHVHREKVIFPKEKLKELHGELWIHVSRTGSFQLQHQTEAGGYISTNYELRVRKTTMVD